MRVYSGVAMWNTELIDVSLRGALVESRHTGAVAVVVIDAVVIVAVVAAVPTAVAVRRLRHGGAAVVVCSTDFQEVGLVSDRVYVMREGRLAGEVRGADATEQRLVDVEMGA